MKSVILILLYCLTSYSIYAQNDNMSRREWNDFNHASDTTKSFKKNALLLTPSFPGGIGLSVAYERFISKSNNLVARLDLFYTYTWDGEATYIGPQLVYLTGKRKGHFEVGIGPMFGISKYMNSRLIPNVHIGYRHQRRGGKFIFRTGLGIPAGPYVGVGLAF